MIPSSFQGFVPAKFVAALFPICAALSLAACSGSDLSVDLPGAREEAAASTGNLLSLEFPLGQPKEHQLPRVSGGIPPYESSIEGCPDWVTLFPDQGVLAGTAPGDEIDRTFFCTYRVTESDPGFRSQQSVTYGLRLVVGPPEASDLMLPEFVVPGNVVRLRVDERARITFEPATEGVVPYTYALRCPDPPPIGPNPASSLPSGLGFSPLTRILSGTPKTAYAGPDCTYSVTDSTMPEGATLARSVALIIEPERTKWRFTQRSLLQEDRPLNRSNVADPQAVYGLPEAIPEAGGTPPQNTAPVYRLLDVEPPLMFNSDPDMRLLTYRHSGSDPQLGTTFTYRYQVLFGDTVDDTLCIDVSYRVLVDNDEDTEDPLIASVRIHDNAYWDGNEFSCPPVPLQPASTSHAVPSNPVHTALAPVHARRALDFSHGTVRDRVRGWTPGAPRVLTAIPPQAGIGSLSGESHGFDYSGSSDSLSTGAEIGAGPWQAGLVGSFTRTELHYRAAASLAKRGYLAGEHDTEIFSLHPFAAWHIPSGGNVWASLGAGVGQLRHRDDLGFPSWSRSDMRLRAYAAGASVPVADMLSGELEAETSIESFAFEIEGGDRISSSLPTSRGRDWRAGLAWRAPIAGAPSLSVAYRHLTGDGPEGGQLEARGSVSVKGLFDPRLTVTGNLEGSFGLGDFEHDSWGLGGGIRFAPGEEDRGFALELDTRLVSLDDGESSDVGIRGEAGYGLWSGPHIGTVRPYVGLTRYSSDGSLRRALGVDLRNTPASRVNVEFRGQPRDRFRTLTFTVRHRF